VIDIDDFDLYRARLTALADEVTALQEAIALLCLNAELSHKRLETAARIFENAQEAE
jgi:hypothetical protein